MSFSRAETERAQTAICPFHDGRIAREPTPQDTPGNVYFCPIGRQYWRYGARTSGMYAPLNLPPSGII